MKMKYTVVGFNTSVGKITVISQSATKADAEDSARHAPKAYFKDIQIIPSREVSYRIQ